MIPLDSRPVASVLGRRVLAIQSRFLRDVLTIQRLADSRLLLAGRSARRWRPSWTFRATQDRLVHRVHVHLQLLHAAERVPGAVHAGEFQGRAENRSGGGTAGALRRLQDVPRVQTEIQ